MQVTLSFGYNKKGSWPEVLAPFFFPRNFSEICYEFTRLQEVFKKYSGGKVRIITGLQS